MFFCQNMYVLYFWSYQKLYNIDYIVCKMQNVTYIMAYLQFAEPPQGHFAVRGDGGALRRGESGAGVTLEALRHRGGERRGSG